MAAAPRLHGPLFVATTCFGVLSWICSAAVVLALKRDLGLSAASTLEIALFTCWLTSVGAAPSLCAVLLEDDRVMGESRCDRVARRLPPALAESPPLVALYVGYMAFQASALLFASATVVCMDSYAAMMLATALFVALTLGEVDADRRRAFGLLWIAASLALVGGAEEIATDDDDDDDGLFGSRAADAALGVGCAACAGVCYAGTNVLYERLLSDGDHSALALNGATTAVAAVLLTALVYPALWLAGVYGTPWHYAANLREAGPVLVSLFVGSKLIWYGLEAILVGASGAVAAALSGVALIPLVWLVELGAYYGWGAIYGVAWSDPGSYLQLAALAALGVGVGIHGGGGGGAGGGAADAAADEAPLVAKGTRDRPR